MIFTLIWYVQEFYNKKKKLIVYSHTNMTNI